MNLGNYDKLKEMLEPPYLMLYDDLYIVRGSNYTKVYDMIINAEQIVKKGVLKEIFIELSKKYKNAFTVFYNSSYLHKIFNSELGEESFYKKFSSSDGVDRGLKNYRNWKIENEEEMVERLDEELNENNFILIPIERASHAMSFIIKKEQNKYDVYFMNSGLGLTYHAQELRGDKLYGKCIIKKKINKEVFTVFIALLTLDYIDINHFYNSVIYLLENNSLKFNLKNHYVELKSRIPTNEDMYEAQLVGNCTFRTYTLYWYTYSNHICEEFNTVNDDLLWLHKTAIIKEIIDAFCLAVSDYNKYNVLDPRFNHTIINNVVFVYDSYKRYTQKLNLGFSDKNLNIVDNFKQEIEKNWEIAMCKYSHLNSVDNFLKLLKSKNLDNKFKMKEYIRVFFNDSEVDNKVTNFKECKKKIHKNFQLDKYFQMWSTYNNYLTSDKKKVTHNNNFNELKKFTLQNIDIKDYPYPYINVSNDVMKNISYICEVASFFGMKQKNSMEIWNKIFGNYRFVSPHCYRLFNNLVSNTLTDHLKLNYLDNITNPKEFTNNIWKILYSEKDMDIKKFSDLKTGNNLKIPINYKIYAQFRQNIENILPEILQRHILSLNKSDINNKNIMNSFLEYMNFLIGVLDNRGKILFFYKPKTYYSSNHTSKINDTYETYINFNETFGDEIFSGNYVEIEKLMVNNIDWFDKASLLYKKINELSLRSNIKDKETFLLSEIKEIVQNFINKHLDYTPNLNSNYFAVCGIPRYTNRTYLSNEEIRIIKIKWVLF